MTHRYIGILGLGAAALVAACGGTNAPPEAASTSTSSGTMSGSTTSSAMSAMSESTSCSPSGTPIKLVAKDTAFDASCLAAPAGQAITVTFDNEDGGIPHNLAIYSADPMVDKSARTLFKGDLITGVKTVTYTVPALPAGVYHFHCDVHPTQMFGSFVVK